MATQRHHRELPKKKAEETKPSQPEREGTNRVLIFTLAVLFVALALLVRNIIQKNRMDSFKSKTIPQAIKKIINNDSTAVNVSAIRDAGSVYEFDMSLGSGSQEQKYTSYITKDGKLLFTSGIKLADLGKPAEAAAPKLTCKDVKKADKPELSAFVVSGCPFGLQMQRVFAKAIGEAADLGNYLDIKYIGSVENGKITSMHGDEEANENLKQICVREEQKDKYWPYVSCYMKAGKSDECSTEAGLDTYNLQACMDDSKRGLAYAQKDFDLANKLKIGSSPTLVANGTQTVSEFDFGGRTADAIKQVACCAGKTQAEFCKKSLDKSEVATSFSENVAAPTGSAGSAGANCGQ